MKKVNLQEGNDALKRALLLMNYDTKKTLTENVETVSEQSWSQIAKGATAGAATGAGIGALGGGLPAIPGAIFGGIFGAVAAAIGNERYETAKNLFASCKTNKTKPTLSIDQLDEIGDAINDAIDGLGTDEDAIRDAFKQIPTIPDLCALINAYKESHGDLFGDLDGDLDSDGEWKDYVLLPLRSAMRRSQQITANANEQSNELKPFQEFIKKDWGSEINGKETYKKDGEFFIVNDGVEDYKYKQDGNTFTYVE